MQRFDIGKFLVKYWWLVLGITAVAAVGSTYLSGSKSAVYYGSMAITVQPGHVYPESDRLVTQSNPSSDTLLLVSTTQSWIADPAYAKDVVERAGISSAGAGLKGYGKVFKVIAGSPNSGTYQVQYSGANEQEVRKAFDALKTVTDELTVKYNQPANSDLKMRLTYSDPAITNESSSLPVTPIAGGVAGFVFAVILAAVIDRKQS